MLRSIQVLAIPPPTLGIGRFAAMAQAQKDAAYPSLQETLQAIDDGVRLLANGATLGYADNLAAAGNALFGAGSFAEDYQKNLAQEQAQSAAARERSGKIGTVHVHKATDRPAQGRSARILLLYRLSEVIKIKLPTIHRGQR